MRPTVSRPHQPTEVVRLSNEIGLQTKETFDERQRTAVLRKQMAMIQRELGEGDEKAQEVAELPKAIVKAEMPEEAERQALKNSSVPSARLRAPLKLKVARYLERDRVLRSR